MSALILMPFLIIGSTFNIEKLYFDQWSYITKKNVSSQCNLTAKIEIYVAFIFMCGAVLWEIINNLANNRMVIVSLWNRPKKLSKGSFFYLFLLNLVQMYFIFSDNEHISCIFVFRQYNIPYTTVDYQHVTSNKHKNEAGLHLLIGSQSLLLISQI
jgi:hypothetical protein